jgi:two-component system, chemotaxis family, response regulator PixG
MGNLTIYQLAQGFQVSHRSHFTGRMDLQSAKGESWSLHFQLGRVVWATGGNHRFRRWARGLTMYCKEISPDGIRLRETGVSKVWEYIVLTVLIKRQRIKIEQAIAIIQYHISEVLFDILQEIDDINQFTCVSENTENLGEPLTMINAEQMLIKAQESWETWCNANLAPYSANLAPVVKRGEDLKNQTSPNTYRTLTSLIDGSSTLRDIATQMKQPPLTVGRSLLPYIHKGLLGLQQVADTPAPEMSISRIPEASNTEDLKQPLVVCIDDSLQICQMMHQIVMSGGYRFSSVQDSTQALPLLIELKPDLIFLDLLMPIANGYEICAQIRRVSALKDIPVVIVTGKDGIVDRVRAKMVGASDFLSKPLEAEKVLAVTRRYLPAPSDRQAGGYEMGDTTAFMIRQSLNNSYQAGSI